MIFPVIECDSVVQINDRFRIYGDKSYKTPDELAWTKVEIEPYAGAGFIDVTPDLAKPKPEKFFYLDFQYNTAGDKIVSLRLTAGAAPVTFTKTVSCILEADDHLFSTDDLLKEQQSDIYKLIPDGRSTFKYKHRAAQNYMLDWLWNNGYYKSIGAGVEPFLKADIVDTNFISDWATFVALRMLFEENINQGGDIFRSKANDFMVKEERAREKFLLVIDIDGDGTLSINEGISVTSRRLVRV